MATKLGRWCLPVGRWKDTCQQNAKGMLADADNSVWTRPPLDVEGKERHAPSPPKDDDRAWVERLLANYHG